MPVTTAVPASVIARVVGIEMIPRDLRAGNIVNQPQRIALLGQGAEASTYALTKRQVYSAFEVGTVYGFGSPLHLAALQLFPVNGGGVGTVPVTVYPLIEDAAATPSDGTFDAVVTTAEAATYRVVVNGMPSQSFTVSAGDAALDINTAAKAAIDASVELPILTGVAASPQTFTAKWGGVSGDGISIAIEGPTDKGVSWTIVQPTGGATNPTAAEVNTALAQMGNVWDSLIINCIDIDDSDILDALQTFGEGRWGALVRKPCMAFTGNPATTVSAAIVIPESRKLDRINCQLVNPGSVNLPFVTAAAQLAKIAVQADSNPPVDYGLHAVPALEPGLDGEQWDVTMRQTATTSGSSSVEKIDDVVHLSDTVTMYHPTGDQNPAYRYVVDVIKLWQVLFNLDIIYASAEWAGKPLVPDDDPTANPETKKPKMATAATAGMLSSLGLASIISDPATAIASIRSGINSQNPKRLDQVFTIQLSGNVNVISIDVNHGFYFGPAEVIG